MDDEQDKEPGDVVGFRVRVRGYHDEEKDS